MRKLNSSVVMEKEEERLFFLVLAFIYSLNHDFIF